MHGVRILDPSRTARDTVVCLCADWVARSYRRRHQAYHRLHRRHVGAGHRHRMELSAVRMRKRRSHDTRLHGRGRCVAGNIGRFRIVEFDRISLRQPVERHAFPGSRSVCLLTYLLTYLLNYRTGKSQLSPSSFHFCDLHTIKIKYDKLIFPKQAVVCHFGV